MILFFVSMANFDHFFRFDRKASTAVGAAWTLDEVSYIAYSRRTLLPFSTKHLEYPEHNLLEIPVAFQLFCFALDMNSSRNNSHEYHFNHQQLLPDQCNSVT
jgi:hypothetical protein